jgi:prepilin-type processing-associated H-X9-DG protein
MAASGGGSFHHLDSPSSAPSAPNHGQWTANPRSTIMLAPDHPLAYWGVAYFDDVGRTRKIFRCPSARAVDEWRETGLRYPTDFWLDSSYGLNQYVVVDPAQANVPANQRTARRLTGFLHPSTTIFAQDGAEQKMEGDSDSWGLWPGFSENLTQWKYSLAGLYPGYRMEMEWFRHNGRGNAVWIDGHVSSVPYTKGVDYRWYTGEAPLESPPDR